MVCSSKNMAPLVWKIISVLHSFSLTWHWCFFLSKRLMFYGFEHVIFYHFHIAHHHYFFLLNSACVLECQLCWWAWFLTFDSCMVTSLVLTGCCTLVWFCHSLWDSFMFAVMLLALHCDRLWDVYQLDCSGYLWTFSFSTCGRPVSVNQVGICLWVLTL